MGYAHALSGCAAWLAMGPAFAATGRPLGPGDVIAGALVCAGAALVPDLDHPSSTIAKTYGVVSQAMSRVIEKAAGGHRQGTHSLLFALLVGIGCQLLQIASELALQVFLFLLLGIALRGIGFHVPKHGIISGVMNAASTVVVLVLLNLAVTDYSWVGAAVTLGILMHFLGDAVTHMGIPLFWPLKTRSEFPFGFKTDGKVERFVVTPLLIVTILVLGYLQLPILPDVPGLPSSGEVQQT
ncbi:metal-dependent hydrolase [Allonocardiopsis opalescens]|uniref:Membrane-bound metal-dependent hydrolase YbcI (DUF457 family) n=1 Tax=Allonocardiopsis opalescens TaxID=1144618 RepID=A0A2T0Q0B1_9ACTN|nr:membrane-bound metal-dependent hydrolase YbcI (DUF457 family) [Allonocardiopsis opalescens]